MHQNGKLLFSCNHTKKALFHISKTELFSYRLSVQACQLDIGWLSSVKVNQTSCLNNLSLVVGHVAGRKVELGGCAVGADCVGFYARKFFRNHLFCARNKNVISIGEWQTIWKKIARVFARKLGEQNGVLRLALLIKERNHSPVNQVRAVAFCGVVACNIRTRSQNPLATCRLLARRTVARLNSVDCRAKTGLFNSSLELRILFLKDFFRPQFQSCSQSPRLEHESFSPTRFPPFHHSS